jgi:chaperonin GroEL
MSKQVKSGAEARSEIKAGIDLVANVVKTTLGPRGRNVVLKTDPYRPPLNTNDGVTIARELHAPADRPFQEIGVETVKAVANKTNDVAGDGTTTVSVLLQAMTTHALQQINNDADPVLLRRGIEKAAAAVVEALQDEIVETKDIEALVNVATISCGDPVIGKLVAEAVHKVGSNGVVTIEDGEGEETTSRIAEGIELRGGIQLPVFITNPARQEADVNDVPIFVTDHDFTNGMEVVRLMEVISGMGHKSGVLIANSVTGEAMASCAINKAQGKFTLIPIKVQALGEQGQAVLRDMAEATGARFFARDEGNRLPNNPQNPADTYNPDDFGHAERVIASRDRTTIIGGAGETEERIKELKAQRANSKQAYEQNAIDERIARLQSGVGVVRVGGVTEAEREERKLRVEDAINASKAALSNGIIAGGGAALYRAATKVQKDQNVDLSTEDGGNGLMAVVKACFEPIKQMAENSGLELDKADLEKVLADKKLTIDFYTGEVVDAFKAGIIDPSLVTLSAIKNAASQAALFAITEGAVTAAEDDSEKI